MKPKLVHRLEGYRKLIKIKYFPLARYLEPQTSPMKIFLWLFQGHLCFWVAFKTGIEDQKLSDTVKLPEMTKRFNEKYHINGRRHIDHSTRPLIRLQCQKDLYSPFLKRNKSWRSTITERASHGASVGVGTLHDWVIIRRTEMKKFLTRVMSKRSPTV